MAHYSKEELDLFRQNKMSVLGRITCSAHLRDCRECSALLEELEQEDSFLKDLKNSVQILDELSRQKPQLPQNNNQETDTSHEHR